MRFRRIGSRGGSERSTLAIKGQHFPCVSCRFQVFFLTKVSILFFLVQWKRRQHHQGDGSWSGPARQIRCVHHCHHVSSCWYFRRKAKAVKKVSPKVPETSLSIENLSTTRFPHLHFSFPFHSREESTKYVNFTAGQEEASKTVEHRYVVNKSKWQSVARWLMGKRIQWLPGIMGGNETWTKIPSLLKSSQTYLELYSLRNLGFSGIV